MATRSLRTAAGITSPLRRSLYRLAILGESTTQGTSDMQSYSFGSTDLVSQTALRSNGALLPVKNAGIGGQTSPFIISRLTRDVLKDEADVIGLLAGTNDVIVLNSDAYIDATLAAFHELADALGVYHFICTIPPYAARASVVSSINTKIRAYCSANSIPLVDLYALSEDPANPGSYKPNWSPDGTHGTQRTMDRWAQEIWRVIGPDLVSKRKIWRPRVQDPANILFPPSGIANTGAPASSTERDGLLINYRTLSLNGYSAPTPRMWDTVATSTGLAPTVTGAIEQIAGVPGNVWKLTMSANAGGAGGVSFAMAHSASSPIIDLRRYQGRKVLLGFWFGAEGLDAINTDAYLAANSNALLASVSLGIGIRDTAGNPIGGTYIQDPIDAAQSLGTSSNIAMRWSLTLWNNSSGYRHGYDVPITPLSFAFNVPPLAHSMNISLGGRFFAGNIGPVIMRVAGFSLIDLGPAEYPGIVVNNDPVRVLKLTASYTLSRADLLAFDVIECDATSGAITVGLPAIAVLGGMRQTFVKTDSSANAVTIDPNASETINGSATYALSSQYSFASAYISSSGWIIIAK